MKLRRFYLLVLPLLILPCLAGSAYADTIPILGTNLSSFAVLGGSTVTNTGPTVLAGNLGVSPGSAITGFFGTVENDGPGVFTGFAAHQADAFAGMAQTQLTTAYNALAATPSTQDLTGTDLGGLTLTPGVYKFSTSAQLTGTLTLNAQGDPNALWIFQIGSTLTTASNSSVVMINGPGGGLFWQVGSTATLGTTTAFEGNILALTSITLNTGATDLCGRALARNGAVTLDTNTIGGDCLASNGLSEGTITNNVVSAVPEPGSMILLGTGLVGLAGTMRRKLKR